ncbi:MAG: Holliday junction resolvase RuvX [Christensenellales bacterium]|nr:Holliday junction resolvase RuvX [Clostridium sp.]MDY2926111.1 Holliday junction resolvase RuvX [Eubacteriales bacterium]MCI6818201.1 Holliday junction resolvase RuvX [Clostridium sp.]MCI6987821.1 Holliday junction resolvase RuvX [Clostridium sp.]MCI7012654.1 Holliday junction resolvase RuvX [Clostridium sp.]
MLNTFRYFAIDVGDKRIGLAVSDALGITAQGLETYNRTGDTARDAEYIRNYARKYAPCRLVFGLPRNMDGSYGPACDKVRAFADAVLEGWDGEHDFYDERLSTVVAERAMYEADFNWKKRRKVVDKMAAQVILQGYLELHPIK